MTTDIQRSGAIGNGVHICLTFGRASAYVGPGLPSQRGKKPHILQEEWPYELRDTEGFVKAVRENFTFLG